MACIQLGSRTGPAHCRKSEAKKLGRKSILGQHATMDEETVDGITSRSATDTGSESNGSDVVFVGISSGGATDTDPPAVMKHKVEDACASRSATDTESESDGSDVVFVGISRTGVTAKDRTAVVKREVVGSHASHSSDNKLIDVIAWKRRKDIEEAGEDISSVLEKFPFLGDKEFVS